ncbi:MAG: UvrD-helicase domain-containing protein [Clostridia bacterium]|nr:UvrD-helicase domain-containing protein [Clostridia bacterium]
MEEIFALEKAHLEETQSFIRARTVRAEAELTQAYDELMQARSGDPDRLPAREMLYYNAKTRLDGLRFALKKTYFTRVDFTPDGGQKEVIYIGKHGVGDEDSAEQYVCDWRAPVANLYYSGQLGRVSYTAPDGSVQGEMSLKRQLEIDGGELKRVFDTDIVSQDAYLQQALSQATGNRLTDIVSTIQSEQNLVIREPLHKNLLVQGAAGSGKTTVALHRIAYLLYAFRDRLTPQRMLILAPSPLFLDYIRDVLPELGVENVQQGTFEGFFTDWLGLKQKLFKADEDVSLRDGRVKGSRAFAERLDAFLDDYEKRFTVSDGLVFGPVRLFQREEIEHFIRVDEAGLPMKRRVEEFHKQLLKRTRAAARSITAWLRTETQRRAAALRQRLPEGEELSSRLRSLAASLDKRVKETEAEVKPFAEKCIRALPSVDPVKVYAEFLKGIPASDAAWPAAERTLGYLEAGKKLEYDDLAALALIFLRMRDMPPVRFRHIVIDEAQDLSFMQYRALKACQKEATFTILGDTMQGLPGRRGVENWNVISEGVFGGACLYRELTTSYRSTRQIMEQAFRAGSVYADCSRIRVIRSGDACAFAACRTERERLETIADILRREAGPGRTVAVLEKDGARAKKLAGKLPAGLNARLLTGTLENFGPGVYVSSALDAKGLQFDAVVIADASKDVYAGDEESARVLYVAMTRALHRLYIVSGGEPAPFLNSSGAAAPCA